MRKIFSLFLLAVFLIITFCSAVRSQTVELTDTLGSKTELPYSYDSKTEILTVDYPSELMESAKIQLPICKGKVCSGKLYTRQSLLDKFEIAEEYCKNETVEKRENITSCSCDKKKDPLCLKQSCVIEEKVISTYERETEECYNQLSIEKGLYVFEVEHFTDYYVNGSDYNTLQECMEAINNTANKCIMNVNNYTETFNNTLYFVNGYLEFGAGNNNITIDFNHSSIYYPASGNRIRVIANNVTLRNINTSSGSRHYYWTGHNGILQNCYSAKINDDNYFSSADYLNVTDCTFEEASLNIPNSDYMNWDNITVLNSDIRAEANKGVMYLQGSSHSRLNNINFTLGDGADADETSCIHFGANAEYNNLTNSVINCKNKIAVELNGGNGYFNHIINNTITNGTIGIYLNTIGHVWRNTVYNTSQEGISNYMSGVGNAESTIINNTITDCGSAHTENFFKIADSKFGYGGNDFNGTTSRMYSANLGSNINIISNDTDVSSIATGLVNFSLWLMDLPAVGLPYVTLYIGQPNAMSCLAVAGAYGGTCFLDEQDFLQAEGGSTDYTIKTVGGLTIIEGANPMFLRHTSEGVQDYALLRAWADNNKINITGNILEIDDGREFYSSAIINGSAGAGGYYVNIWLNQFRTHPVDYDTGRIHWCINNQGNFYGEGVEIPPGDCGVDISVDCSENMTLQYDRNMLNKTLYFQNAGFTKLSSRIYNFNKIVFDEGCSVALHNGTIG